MNKTEAFLASLDALQKRAIPEEALARARRSLLDYLAVTCAGAGFQRENLCRYLTFSRPETGAFTAIGMGKKLALMEAVFLNGLNGHALDLDDGTNAGIIHLGSPIFSLLLPLAQRDGASVDQLLRCAVIGYEASYTMAVSIQPGHKALGYHATGTCGALGATLAAAYMLGFTPEERARAFAAACVSATGMLAALDDGSELKPYNVAKTALLALTALRLAKAGFEGPADPLGGKRGYLKMMTGKADVELLPLCQKGTYAIQKSYTKPYASCRYTHPAVEAAIRLRNEHGLRPEDIESVDVRTYALAIPGHEHTRIPGPYSAKMSIPYSTAVGLLYGRAGLQEFSEEIVQNANVRALTEKVAVHEDDALSAAFPDVQAAIVSIRLRDGVQVSARVDHPKGEPENPLSDAEFRDRYDGLMAFAGVAPADSAAVFEAVSHRGDATAEDILKHL